MKRNFAKKAKVVANGSTSSRKALGPPALVFHVAGPPSTLSTLVANSKANS